MSHIVIRFIGICVHVSQENLPGLEVAHRIIFPSHDDADIDGQRVDAHQPVIVLPKFIASGDAPPCVEPLLARGGDVLLLKRVRIRVANPVPNGFGIHESFLERVPHLTPPGIRLSPRREVMLHHEPPAAAYFDADFGTLSACLATKEGAVGTTLTVETEGDPILEVRCFDSEERTRQWQFNGDLVRVQIYNISSDRNDSESDYLINYKTCEPLPSPPPPRERNALYPLDFCLDADETRAFGGHLELSPACSNTNYP